MKYYVEYPIKIQCGLKCPYCFHKEAWDLQAQSEEKFEKKYTNTCPFTVEQFLRWRNMYLFDAEEFICDLHGGEMSHEENIPLVLEILDKMDKTKFQLQTNGLGETDFYLKLIDKKDKIDYVSFTYHRQMMEGRNDRIDKFVNNVLLLSGAGIKVFVKELLLPGKSDVILAHKQWWETNYKIELRIQDYRPKDRGYTVTPYTAKEQALIHPEYTRHGKTCACRNGYKNILIRGYDCFAGDVIACWKDPVVIGHIGGYEEFYNSSYKIERSAIPQTNGDILMTPRVCGVPEIFRGTFPRDLWTDEVSKQYPALDKKQLTLLNKRSQVMLQNLIQEAAKEVEKYNQDFQQAQQTIQQHQSAISQLQQEIDRVTRYALEIRGKIGAWEEIQQRTIKLSADASEQTPETNRAPEDAPKE